MVALASCQIVDTSRKEPMHALEATTKALVDIRKLESGVHVVFRTPGRVWDMINRKALKTKSIKDEADKMLSQGFKKKNYEVYRNLPYDLQVFLVINYDLLNDRGIYIHRTGRSDRFGRKVDLFTNRLRLDQPFDAKLNKTQIGSCTPLVEQVNHQKVITKQTKMGTRNLNSYRLYAQHN
ncbi:hypothetical protein LguiB_010249 [Lonicera macranthoides]